MAATYAWYQYLGAVRFISRDYVSPVASPKRFSEEAMKADYQELVLRDVGQLFSLIVGRTCGFATR